MNTLPDPNDFQRLLDDAGSDLDAADAMEIIHGVAAAPIAGDDPERWLGLIAAAPGDALKSKLMDTLAETRAAGEAGESGGSAAERLDALRNELRAREVDGFIVPKSDEHQGEYVANRAERLAWLTGFTGSAGLAVVLTEKAAVFADGRYTLQAEAEVDGNLYERRHLTDQPATEWITENLGKGQKLAYDPWLLTPGQVTRYGNACRAAGAELTALDDNPVDTVWTDQPPPPMAPITALADAFAGETTAEKCARMADELTRAGSDAVVLTAPDSIAWLLNVRGGDVPFTPFALSFAVLHADATVDWFVDARKFMPGLVDGLGNKVRIAAPGELGAVLDSLGAKNKTVRADPASAPAWISSRLSAAGAKLERAADPCQHAKACKNPAQVTGMLDAHVRDGAAVCRFLKWLDDNAESSDITEMTACDVLEGYRRENDYFRGLSFPTIAGSGPNGAIVHYRVSDDTNRKLGQGELFLVDSGAQYLDGTTDITRTIAIGAPSPDMRKHFTLVLKGHIALARARFPADTSGSQLDILARHALWAEGLDYDHGTGHGVGSFLSVHEGPHRITKAPNRVGLEPGMVVSNEPGFYKTGAYGIRIENLVVVTAIEKPDGAERDIFGFETLTLAPFDRSLIDLGLLAEPEIQWIDAYHARVLKTIAPFVDANIAEWLGQATAPLS
ncbi:MAG: aminopeptidase P family protein [Rhodospirillaceae bacterium]|nr:aminopeptidase P family protein [Rhodospirillaceae bacterium]MBT6883246.1 aminopeptidase P family protein [Rhodospirillaceae bacterium]